MEVIFTYSEFRFESTQLSYTRIKLVNPWNIHWFKKLLVLKNISPQNFQINLMEFIIVVTCLLFTIYCF